MHTIVTLLLAALFTSPAFRQGDLSNDQLVKQGKEASALVVINNHGVGTAFCVEKHGWFITNHHVVRGTKSEIKLVLNSGLKSEKTIKVQVVRQDEKNDLALLRSEDQLELTALAFSPSSSLSELTEIVAFGFPFGSALSLTAKENPAISVNVGKVTAMRRSLGELQYVQVDALLNRGNSGGPLLNRQGKVVGIVVAGIERTGVNLAIPSEHALALLNKPDIQLRLPALNSTTLDRPADFQATVTSIHGTPKLEAILSLRLDDQPERTVPMNLDGKVFRAQVFPVPAQSREKPVTVTAQLDDGTIIGKAADVTVMVQGKPFRLRDIKQIQFTPSLLLTMRDGIVHKDINPLGKLLTVTLGGKEIPLDVSKIKELRIAAEMPPQTLSVKVTILQEGKEVASATDSVFLGATASAPAGEVKRQPIQQPVLEQNKLERKLPSTITDVAVGGGGKFILLLLTQVRQVAVFDVSQARVIKYIPVEDDDVHLAAGQEKLFIAMNNKRVLQRWDLEALTLEATVPLPCQSVQFLLMGYASHGPLIISKPRENDNGTLYLNIETLKELPVAHTNEIGYDASYGCQWRISGDGTVLAGWTHGISPASFGTHILKGLTLHRYTGGERLAYCRPGRDGKVLYTSAGLFTQECIPFPGHASPSRGNGKYTIPSTSGEWYLSFTPSTVGSDARLRSRQPSTPATLQAALHVVGRPEELANLPQLDMTGIPVDVPYTSKLLFDKRVVFVPEAKIVVTIPVTNDRLVMQRFDVDEALEKSAFDYLFVSSLPATKATRGELYRYQLNVRSKKGGVKYRLDAAPEGMKLSSNGELTWSVPQEHSATSADVIITISDASGQEVLHNFRIHLQSPAKVSP